ncbi:Eukaryotic translation initiation factor 4B [Streptomyces misionensis JCM 4497]
MRDTRGGAAGAGPWGHRRVRARRRGRAHGGHGDVPADQGRGVPLPARAAAHRPSPGRLAGHVEPGRRRGDAAGGPGGVRLLAGRPAAPQEPGGRLGVLSRDVGDTRAGCLNR